jgi:hypothetical protein
MSKDNGGATIIYWDHDEAIRAAKRDAWLNNKSMVLLPMIAGNLTGYMIMSYEAWAWSSEGDPIAWFDKDGKQTTEERLECERKAKYD